MENVIFENDKAIIKTIYIGDKKCAALYSKDDKLIETFAEVYLDTLYENRLVVRSNIPPYLAGVIDLNRIGTSTPIYSIPLTYFKILFFKEVGYLLVLSPNDCILTDHHFKTIPPGRCERVTVLPNKIIGERNGEKIIIVY